MAALLAGLVLIAPPKVRPGTLTVNGVQNFRPERDSFIYLGAGVIAVVSALLLSRLQPVGSRWSASRRVRQLLPIVFAGAAVAVSTGAFLRVRRHLPLGAPATPIFLGMPIVVAAGCALVAQVTGWRESDGRRLRRGIERVSVRTRLGPLDLVAPVLVIALVYLPGWRELAGNAFLGEGALHLDFFAFGPALAFRSGVALGTDLHPYYGLGWPMLFSHLNPLSYGHIIRLEVVYGCLYFIGVYLLLRALVGDRRWATVGTALAILFQLFSGWPAGLSLWRFPSATVMRWPFDVWFFLACLFHLRSGRTVWAVVAGALVALAVVFQTDTGVSLGVAFAFFWVCVWRAEGARSLPKLAWSAATAVAVGVVGMGIASRWTLFSGAFVAGLVENLQISMAGGTLLALTTEPTSRNIAMFVLIAGSYLTLVGWSAVHAARRRMSTSTVMLGCIALYGFFTFSYFVGRSNPLNLYRPTVPFAILIGAGGGLAHRAWVAHQQSQGRSLRLPAAAAWAGLAVAVAMLIASPGVRAYPGLIRTALAGSQGRGSCLFENPDDVCGLPPEANQSVRDLHALAARLRALGSTTTSVAVLDEIGPVIQQMAGARPWGRYLPLFAGMFTQAQQRAVLQDLREEPPSLVVMRASAKVSAFYADDWRAMRGTVEREFLLDSSEGPWEIWRRRPG